MTKISRVRTGCWTCKRRHRKCDETKPTCKNCNSTGRVCEGYGVRYLFDTDSKKPRRGRTAHAAPSPNEVDNSNASSSVMPPSVSPSNFSSSHQLNSRHSTITFENSDSLRQSTTFENSDSLRQSTTFENSNSLRQSTTNFENSNSLRQSTTNFENSNSLQQSTTFDNSVAPERNKNLQFTPIKGTINDQSSNTFHICLYENEDLLFSQIFGNINAKPKQHMTSTSILGRPDRIFDRNVDNFMSHAPKLSLKLSFQEENKLLKHFFKSLLPLLDAHPHSPWPNLALRYCDFNLARSCFISLACIHLYSKEGDHEYYKQGIAHIHSTMQYLITYISNNEKLEQTREEKYSQSFIILVLVNVHILFAVLDKGQSSLSRYLFKVFGSICSDRDFCSSLLNHESKGALIVVLSWYDTVSAVVSPDCRVPFCKPELYGSSFNAISTTQMMGCPGEIFRAMYEVCYLRHRAFKGELKDDMDFNHKFQSVKEVLFGYRDYIEFDESQNYNLHLKGAQCWSLAVYVTALRIFKTDMRRMLIKASVSEFIDVYGSMPSDSPLVTQMVWPLYAMACECTNEQEKESFRVYMNKLNENGQMGTLSSLRWIVKEVWRRNTTQEAVLEEWLEDGVDYHPL